MAAGKQAEDSKSINTLWMVEGQVVAHTAAAIMPCKGKTFVTEMLHEGDHVSGHGTFGVGFVVDCGRGLRGFAIAA